MRVLDKSIYRGPHLYSGWPMIRFALDLEDLEDHPTSDLPGFVDGLVEILPGLAEHRCSVGRAGGLVQRLHDGTWIGHVVEHVALELQATVGTPVGRGKTRSLPGRPGVYNVMFAYEDVDVALLAGRMALELVASLLPPGLQKVAGLGLLSGEIPLSDGERIPGWNSLARLAVSRRFGPTSQGIVDAAKRRKIPWERVDERSFIRFGHGAGQRYIRASMTDATSHLGVITAGDKAATKTALLAVDVPVPKGVVLTIADDLSATCASLRRPLVVKPLNGNHGRGITLGVVSDTELAQAVETAHAHSARVIVEEQLVGKDYRVLVVNGRVAAAAERVPPSVTGDGLATIRQLVEQLNADPRRGRGHENVLTRIPLDATTGSVLQAQELNAESVPRNGYRVRLRETGNLSTGAEAVDVTADIHPENVLLAEDAAAALGLDIAGIDVITPDISSPISASGGGVVEVNAAPGFRMHLSPSIGSPQDVGGAVIDMLYPPGTRSRIPIIAVTGTNGKSTVVRMIAHILTANGKRVGMTTTSGVYIGNRLVKAVDASGPRSARHILAHPRVEAAVLETARGGILREGLAYDLADVGVVLNVSSDHLGLKGVDTLEDLAKVKAVVARQVRRRGTVVLNADDPFTRRMARRARSRVAFFTLFGDSLVPALQDHIARGGVLAAPVAGTLTIMDGARHIALLPVNDIPATLEGAATVNIANALAAAAAAYAQGVPPEVIESALRTFDSSYEQNPGRMNVTTAPGFTTIVDYAHNPAALRALGQVVSAMRAQHDRAIGVVSTPGDRRDEDILEMGHIAAGIFDELIFRELPDGRGRNAGGVLALLTQGAMDGGADPASIRRVADEREAMALALSLAGSRDLVALMPSDVGSVWQQVLDSSPVGAGEKS